MWGNVDSGDLTWKRGVLCCDKAERSLIGAMSHVLMSCEKRGRREGYGMGYHSGVVEDTWLGGSVVENDCVRSGKHANEEKRLVWVYDALLWNM